MPPHEIPALPVLLPVTAAVLGALLWWLHRSGRLTAPRAGVAVAACLYGAVVTRLVLLPMTLATMPPLPWRIWLHLTPLVDVLRDPTGMILNVAMFVPLGLLLPLVVRVDSVRRVLLIGFLASLGIETLQLLADVTVSPGRIADVDDLIGNTCGAVLGYTALRLLRRVPAVARLGDRASWATLPDDEQTSALTPLSARR